jgi:CO dehydrogenase/acetyl-CoA synthase alpha subunit
MDLFKKILELIISFFNKKTVDAQLELHKEVEEEQAVVQQIRADENAQALVQQEKTQEALAEVQEKQKKERKKKRSKKTDDEQFGSEW